MQKLMLRTLLPDQQTSGMVMVGQTQLVPRKMSMLLKHTRIDSRRPTWHPQNNIPRISRQPGISLEKRHHSKLIGTRHYKHFKISTHHTNTKKLHWLPIKHRIECKLCLPTYKTLTNQQPTQSFISVSFCSYKYVWFTCSFHSICSSLGKRAFSVIHSLLIPEIRILY